MKTQTNSLTEQYWKAKKDKASMVASYCQHISNHDHLISFYRAENGSYNYYIETQIDGEFNSARKASPEEVKNQIDLCKKLKTTEPVFYSNRLMEALDLKLAERASAFEVTYLVPDTFEQMYKKDSLKLMAQYSMDDAIYCCYKDRNKDSLDYYCEILSKLTRVPLLSVAIKMSPQQMSNTVAFMNRHYKWDRSAVDFAETLEQDVQRNKARTVSLINQVEDLSNQDACILEDADTVLSDHVQGNISFLDHGFAQKIFDLYKDPTQRETVEKMFKIFTGDEINNYLEECVSTMYRELTSASLSEEDSLEEDVDRE